MCVSRLHASPGKIVMPKCVIDAAYTHCLSAHAQSKCRRYAFKQFAAVYSATQELSAPAMLCNSCCLRLALSGRKPTKVNAVQLKPDATKARRKADGPAMGTTRWPAAAAAATKPLPGSLINGIPAYIQLFEICMPQTAYQQITLQRAKGVLTIRIAVCQAWTNLHRLSQPQIHLAPTAPAPTCVINVLEAATAV